MLDKLERKFGRFAVPHLMRWLVIGMASVYVLYMIRPDLILYLNFVPSLVAKGQVWRIFTFPFMPPLSNVFMTLLSLFCYYWIGEALERSWGAFRFNLFFLTGWICVMVMLCIFGVSFSDVNTMLDQMSYFYQSMFIALASLYPDTRILLFYFIPMKAKWAGVISLVFIAVEFIQAGLAGKMLILFSFIPYLLYFVPGWIGRFKAWKRRRDFNKQVSRPFQPAQPSQPTQPANGQIIGRITPVKVPKDQAGPAAQAGAKPVDRDQRKAFHRCAVCGITELDDPNMTFRYCSQCNGNYEYCERHIHNHVHVK